LNVGRLGQVALVVAILYAGRPVLVPLALSLYLAFILTPASNRLEQWGLPRGLSVAAVLTAALGALFVLGALLVAQVADLASKLHAYSSQMASKLASLRGDGFKLFRDSSRALSELARGVEQQLGTGDQLTAVRVVPGGASAMQRLEETAGPVLEPVAGLILVLVLTVFVLAHREDLRGRLILLLGTQNVTVTTRTMTEAFTRVSHLLLTQAYINSAFGAVIAAGLYVIGVPYALLWGAIAGILRFVPLLGPMVATLLPTLVAFVSFPGWQQSVLTVGLFLVVDMALANFIEPLVLGRRTGVSALALLISAVFWTWLWGGLGLLLATPITVCAAAVGRHVSELRFLAVALGDEPGLNPDLNFYQRTLARASKDAYRLLRRKVADSSLVAASDQLLIPALRLMVTEQRLHAINQDVADRLVSDLIALVIRLRVGASDQQRQNRAIVGVGAETLADALLLRLLDSALAERGVALHALPPSTREQSLATTVAQRPALVCIAALPPAGNTNARFLCRRLRAELPGAYILVLAPETEQLRSREAEARLREAGANQVVTTMTDATRLLLQESERCAPVLPSSRTGPA
jgi:predicted PurR-regulated permease PerM